MKSQPKAQAASRTPVYLDYQATTPIDPCVLDAMLPYLTERYGNPHSAAHRFGWEAAAAVDVARQKIAQLIGAKPEEIIFTSGATESNNLAIKGVAYAYGHKKRHLVTTVIEHKCVLESMRALERQGFSVTYLPVNRDGLIALADVAAAIDDHTALVSVMAVNNEIGVIEPIAEVGRLCRERGAKFHVDAAQAAGKIALDVEAMNIDLMSLSAHKMYGPKGVGALYVRKKPRVVLEPLFHGGGQEQGLRAGTLAPALIVGFGEAAAIAARNMATETARIEEMSKTFLAHLHRALNNVTLNGSETRRYWGNLNISFDGVDGERLLAGLRDVAVSSGAACASGSKEPSYVLAAIGVSERQAKSSLRIGFGRFTTDEDITAAADTLIAAVRRIRGEVEISHA
ncbi:MAG: IscS subfamily cysteine desulfurase [Sphingomonadales bacterium]|nr:IscS subfamily cysteine desulfurase [Sphingomonadales bacterium]